MTVPGNLSSPLLATAAAAAAAGGGITKSVRFNSADSAFLNRTPSSAGNRKKYTWSTWVKRSSTASWILTVGTSADTESIYFNGGHLVMARYVGSFQYYIETEASFLDFSSWYSIVIAHDHSLSTSTDRIKLYVNGVRITDFKSGATFPPQNSEYETNSTENHKIGRYANAYLADLYFINDQQLDPTSFGAFDDNGVWQASSFSGSFGTNGFHLLDFASESTVGHDSSGNNNDFTANNITPATIDYASGLTTSGGAASGYPASNVFDSNTSNLFITSGSSTGTTWTFTPPSSIAATSLVIKVSQGAKYRVNGGSYTTFSGGGSGELTLTSSITGGAITSIEGYSLGEYQIGLWYIKVNGNFLFSDQGADNDVLFDVPVNGTQSDTGAGGELSSNYCTWNPLDKNTNVTLSNGNLQAACGTTEGVNGTIALPASGKYYFEVEFDSFVAAADTFSGLMYLHQSSGTRDITAGGTRLMIRATGNILNNSSSSSSTAFGAGDILGVACDCGANSIQFYKNGSSIGSAQTLSPAPDGTNWAPYCGSSNGACTFILNTGQRAFAYSAPSSYKCLNSANLPTPTIADGSAHFESKLYTGNGSTNALTMSNSSMSPDIVWIHERSTTGDYELFDSVRGANKVVETNSKNPQSTVANTLTSFDSNGFTLGSSSLVNDNNVTYVGWSWDSGSSNASNTTGSINSTCRTNIAAGISIVTYTGSGSAATVGHSLGVAPEFIVIKNLDASKNHIVYHAHMHSSPAEKAMNLNETTEIYDSAGTFNDTAPTSTVFSVGTGAATNASGEGHRALCFAPVSGFSAMGKYDGTGNSDTGAFNYTGMRPAWVMIKRITNQESWVIYDTSRNTHNPTVSRLYADLSNAESDNTSHYIDILSNGFRVRSGGGLLGASSNEYLYVAFAEHPFQANGGLAR